MEETNKILSRSYIITHKEIVEKLGLKGEIIKIKIDNEEEIERNDNDIIEIITHEYLEKDNTEKKLQDFGLTNPVKRKCH